MHKGHVWVNGHALGRYWLVRAPADGCSECPPGSWVGKWGDSHCRSGCGQPTQRYYHVPRSWLRADGRNEVTMLEEGTGAEGAVSPHTVSIVRRNQQQ